MKTLAMTDHNKMNVRMNKIIISEKDAQVALVKILKAKGIGKIQEQVRCDIGTIDILTESHLIEIKSAEKWKHGLGQVLAYGYVYPNHTCHLHLFNVINTDMKVIGEVCEQYDVIVTDHDDKNFKDRFSESCVVL